MNFITRKAPSLAPMADPITEATVLRDALLAFAKTTVGREKAIALSLAARANEIADAIPA